MTYVERAVQWSSSLLGKSRWTNGVAMPRRKLACSFHLRVQIVCMCPLLCPGDRRGEPEQASFQMSHARAERLQLGRRAAQSRLAWKELTPQSALTLLTVFITVKSSFHAKRHHGTSAEGCMHRDLAVDALHTPCATDPHAGERHGTHVLLS